jgi:ribulose-5-phosphate 4-epimerase/fuculose-1-phosphate aldolase
MSRLDYIANITRQKTTQINTDNGLVLKWYFDCFAQKQTFSNKEIDIPDEQEFVDIVREYAETFHDILKPAANVTRFLGNCSMKPNTPPQVGRCSKGMPSFRKNGYVFVSQRNVDKEYLTLEHFVPTYLENNEVYYCGPNKPSVDTPIQLRLYEKLPNIHYMIHAHVYASDAAFTSYPIPCGAIEEVDEIIDTILREYGDLNQSKYILNLKGHGSIVMGQTLDDIKDIKYYGRTLPERFDT